MSVMRVYIRVGLRWASSDSSFLERTAEQVAHAQINSRHLQGSVEEMPEIGVIISNKDVSFLFPGSNLLTLNIFPEPESAMEEDEHVSSIHR